jgi:hypothetical protein
MKVPLRFRLEARQSAGAAAVLLTVVAALAVLLLVLLAQRQSGPAPRSDSAADPRVPSGLSEATLDVIGKAGAGIEIRYYALIPGDQGNAARQAFAGRAKVVIDAVVAASDGKFSARTWTDMNQAESHPAAAEGLLPARQGQRGAGYFGLVVQGPSGQKAVLPQLDPAWEAAFEFDLARAIAKVAGLAAGSEVVLNPGAVNLSAVAELRAALPDLDKMTRTEAQEKLRAAALEEYRAAALAVEQAMASARQEILAAGETVAARDRLHQLHLEQTEKLSAIPRRLEAQLAALDQIKP